MYELTKKDFELIEHAKKVIQANYDETNDRHTVSYTHLTLPTTPYV